MEAKSGGRGGGGGEREGRDKTSSPFPSLVSPPAPVALPPPCHTPPPPRWKTHVVHQGLHDHVLVGWLVVLGAGHWKNEVIKKVSGEKREAERKEE